MPYPVVALSGAGDKGGERVRSSWWKEGRDWCGGQSQRVERLGGIDTKLHKAGGRRKYRR